MSLDAKAIVETVTGLVQSAQGDVDIGNSAKGYETYTNILNLAGTIAGTSLTGVGIKHG